MYSVIVASGEDITCMAVSGYIQRTMHDFKVDAVFSNGLDALEFLNETPANVVFADIHLPGLDGLELTQRISERYPGTMVILICGYNEFEYARRAISSGVALLLLKPLNFRELAMQLEQAKEKLDSLSIDMEFTEEDIQLFFSDLVGGMITHEEELEQRFSCLPLPGALADYTGCLMAITLKKSEVLTHWKYGREKLAGALLDGVRRTLTEYQCFHLFRSGMRYYFIILSTCGPPVFSLELLANVLYHLLHFTCEFNIKTAFSHIRQLAPFSCTQKGNAPSEKAPPRENDDSIIQKAKAYIHAHYAEDLNREEVADAVFLSPAYFSRFFKQKTGMNFIDYLTSVRMQKATELLSTNIKVGDLPQKLGYQSRNRFFINFRQHTGYSPTEYRKLILKKEDPPEDI